MELALEPLLIDLLFHGNVLFPTSSTFLDVSTLLIEITMNCIMPWSAYLLVWWFYLCINFFLGHFLNILYTYAQMGLSDSIYLHYICIFVFKQICLLFLCVNMNLVWSIPKCIDRCLGFNVVSFSWFFPHVMSHKI